MWIDVKDWQRFFDSQMGRTYLHLIQPSIVAKCTHLKDQKVLGIGFALPYLDMLSQQGEDRACIAAMPSYLGACHWPDNKPNRVALVDETRLPFADNYFDMIIVAHCLEFSGHQHSLLREIWRILNNQGKIMVLSANKLSLWSSIGKTPLTQGGSFTSSQLLYLLQSNLFIPTSFQQDLYMPPFQWCARNRSVAKFLNKTVGGVLPAAGGIILAEAYKQTIIPPKVEKAGSWLRWLQGKPQKATTEYQKTPYKDKP